MRSDVFVKQRALELSPHKEALIITRSAVFCMARQFVGVARGGLNAPPPDGARRAPVYDSVRSGNGLEWVGCKVQCVGIALT